MARNYSKICIVCGKEFKKGALAKTCSDSCRVYLMRLLKKGKRPEYLFVAMNMEKRTSLNILSEKKYIHIEEKQEKIVVVKEEPKKEIAEIFLTKEQILLKISEINKEIAVLKREQSPTNQHPRVWRLAQDDKIADLENEIKKLNQP